MKCHRAIIVSLLFLATLAACAVEPQRYAIVEPRSGLVLREGPSPSARRLMVLPANTKVAVLERGNRETIGGRKGHWTRVRHYTMTGWVFGGYLIPYESLRTAWVSTRGGLSLKRDPSFSAGELAAIPYGERLEILEPDRATVEQRGGGIFGYVKARWQSMTGYALDSDLSFIRIPDYGIRYDRRDQERYDREIEAYFNGTFHRFGDDKKSILANLGRPREVLSNKHPNIHDPASKNIVERMEYRGLVITVWSIPSGRDLLVSMEITSGELIPGLELLGGPVQNLFRRFGVPSSDDGAELGYDVGDSGYCGMRFRARGKVVTGITLYCNPD
ncbi:MAG: SH3 domain-containing protein [Spirochaetes bacterium]|nr:SH3 domain-containing protein [Spirochaetota bacterium]